MKNKHLIVFVTLFILMVIASPLSASMMYEFPLNSPAALEDRLYAEDVSDTTDHAQGTTKHMTIQDVGDVLRGYLFLDTPFGVVWDGDITHAPSADVLYDELWNYLRKDNTTPFTPTLDNHPATKKYVDDHVTSGSVEDEVFGPAWATDTVHAGSQKSLYDILHQYDSNDDGLIDNIVDLSSTYQLTDPDLTIAAGADSAGNDQYFGKDGAGTVGFHDLPSSGSTIENDIYGAPWDGDLEGTSKDTIYDTIEGILDGTRSFSAIAVDPETSPGWTFYDADGAGAAKADKEAARISVNMETVTQDAEDGKLDFRVMEDGAENTYLSIDGNLKTIAVGQVNTVTTIYGTLETATPIQSSNIGDLSATYQLTDPDLTTASGADSAGNDQYFGKDGSGTVGFHNLPSGDGTVEDAAYDVSWDGDLDGTSKNTIYDTVESLLDGTRSFSAITVDPGVSPGWTFYDADGTGTAKADKEAARISVNMETVTQDAEDGKLDLRVMEDGAENTYFSMDGNLKTIAIGQANIVTTVYGTLETASPIRSKPETKTIVLTNPNLLFDGDAEYCVWVRTNAAITIDRIDITCDAVPTNDPDIDLMHADDFISQTNATVIAALDTTSGVAVITDPVAPLNVAAAQCIYVRFNADPEAAIGSINIDLLYHFN